ncbi:MAG: elongation factor P maturation arginine rhamnosyltransferase EarP [Burkholderiales bacterium]|nr:elongation factor P maturation arginine rhamnosyltransferase EarP [Burkholderiales bacterium]
MPAPRWTVFCRVVDNLGDAGVGWRLATGLAALGQRVRLVIDDAAPLAFMAPAGAPGVEVQPWPGHGHGGDAGGEVEVGDVVIEAFGCDPPPAFVDAMAARASPPVWINLEYLSAEAYVERSHGLPSPQPGGLVKWFYYPGFTPRTGGLLRESGLAAARAAFDPAAWLASQGLRRAPGERLASLFCYDGAPLAALLPALAREPTRLLVTQGVGAAHDAALGVALPGLRVQRLPWLSQDGFDRLLWACDLNFVRGEDSLVRAIWAGAPFVWQAYPQHDGAHAAKVEALLAQAAAGPEVARLWRAWNGLPGAGTGLELPEPAPWAASVQRWRSGLLAQPDLAAALLAFARGKAGTGW